MRSITDRAYSYSDEDQLQSAGEASYEYDLDGFLTRKTIGGNETSYQYSRLGQLLRVDLPDGRRVEYVHDALGRPAAKKIDGEVTEKYLWAGLTRLLATYNPDDSLHTRFEYAGGRMPVSMTRDGARYYLIHDQVGTLRAVMDQGGSPVKLLEYDSFGNVVSDSAPEFAVPFGFAGGFADKDTGLVRIPAPQNTGNRTVSHAYDSPGARRVF